MDTLQLLIEESPVIKKRSKFKNKILNFFKKSEQLFLSDEFRQEFNENSKNKNFFEKQNTIFKTNSSIVKKLFALNYLEIKIFKELEIELCLKHWRDNTRQVKLSIKGKRFKGKCLKCDKKITKYKKKEEVKDMIFKKTDVDFKQLCEMKPKQFLRRVGVRVDAFHKVCYMEKVAEEGDFKLVKKEVEEEEIDLMDLLDSINDIKVERDYLGAMKRFDRQIKRIDDEMYGLF